jgi:GDP-L-fucose synthase
MYDKNLKIYVAGHTGLVGSAIYRELLNRGFTNIITRTHKQLDLTNQSKVVDFFNHERPEQVYLAAGKVGGIYANNAQPADFIYQNLMIESNVINSAFENNVTRLLFLGSSCIYPKLANQPITENELLTNTLEPTNEPYAIAKIAGIKLCESYNRQFSKSHGIDYRSVMPTNLYGPGDNYHPKNSHVIPALILKLHEAKLNNKSSIEVWGTGMPRREFLYIDDLSDACIHIMNMSKQEYIGDSKTLPSHINIGAGEDMTIKELVQVIKKIVGFNGKIVFDNTKPDGSPRKLLDSSLINGTGWNPKVSIIDGLTQTYKAFLSDHKQ